MRLVEIKDVREKQIYLKEDEYYLIIGQSLNHSDLEHKYVYNIHAYNKDLKLTSKNETKYKENLGELIGFLGITHKLDEDKLIEISRKDFEEDDIIEITQYQLSTKDFVKYKDIVKSSRYEYNCFGSYIYFWCLSGDYKTQDVHNIEKVGTLGVNYEFVNEALIKQ